MKGFNVGDHVIIKKDNIVGIIDYKTKNDNTDIMSAGVLFLVSLIGLVFFTIGAFNHPHFIQLVTMFLIFFSGSLVLFIQKLYIRQKFKPEYMIKENPYIYYKEEELIALEPEVEELFNI